MVSFVKNDTENERHYEGYKTIFDNLEKNKKEKVGVKHDVVWHNNY